MKVSSLCGHFGIIKPNAPISPFFLWDLWYLISFGEFHPTGGLEASEEKVQGDIINLFLEMLPFLAMLLLQI